MTTQMAIPSTTEQLNIEPSSMTSECSSKSMGRSPEMTLPVIDETKPCLDVYMDDDSKEKGEWRVGSPSESPCRKKCMKDRLKGLADKYVACLQVVDGAGDVRGFAGGGGPIMIHGPDPFSSSSSSRSSD